MFGIDGLKPITLELIVIGVLVIFLIILSLSLASLASNLQSLATSLSLLEHGLPTKGKSASIMGISEADIRSATTARTSEQALNSEAEIP